MAILKCRIFIFLESVFFFFHFSIQTVTFLQTLCQSTSYFDIKFTFKLFVCLVEFKNFVFSSLHERKSSANIYLPIEIGCAMRKFFNFPHSLSKLLIVYVFSNHISNGKYDSMHSWTQLLPNWMSETVKFSPNDSSHYPLDFLQSFFNGYLIKF